MSDFAAGPPAGGGEGPARAPLVLLVALAVATLIAVTLVAFLVGSGGGDADSRPARGSGATAPAEGQRVRLTVSFKGGGSGDVRIAPVDITCSESCVHEFAIGARLTATAEAQTGSTFDGWAGACDGVDRCSFVIHEQRSLSVTFERSASDARCEDPIVAAETPACADDGTGAPVDSSGPAPDCQDGRDNDGDGLTDSEQDPGCDDGATEADPGEVPSAPTTTTPPPVTTNECADGDDNDGDGLTDRAQDPDCVTGTSESAEPARASRPRPECRDGKDNDDDGLIDTAQDPGCEADRTEAD